MPLRKLPETSGDLTVLWDWVCNMAAKDIAALVASTIKDQVLIVKVNIKKNNQFEYMVLEGADMPLFCNAINLNYKKFNELLTVYNESPRNSALVVFCATDGDSVFAAAYLTAWPEHELPAEGFLKRVGSRYYAM